MKQILLWLVFTFLSITSYSQNELFNNGIAAGGSGVGGFVTPGTGAGGAAVSQLESPMTTLGAGAQVVNRNRVADDFTIPAGTTWTIDSVRFYCYQTGSTTASSITEVRFRIWNGIPGEPSSTVLFGDTTTNRMTATYWTGVYRVSTDLNNTQRPIMAVRANLPPGGLVLGEGTYWIDWSFKGSLASGPWANPITIPSQQTTGNARQSQGDGAFNPLKDGGTNTDLGLPFVLFGDASCTVTFSAGANGSLSATVDGTPINSGDAVALGKNVVFTATPNAGYGVAEWTLNGNPIVGNTSNNYTITNIQAGSNVTVSFGALYTVNFSAGANGSIAATVDGSPITSGASVLEGKDVVFTATPNAGYRVAQWTLNSTPISGNTSNNYTLTNLQANANVVVTFEAIPTYTVTFSAGSNGSIAATVDGSPITSGASVLEGKNVVFTATPNADFRVAEWTLNGNVVSGNNTNNFTIENLQAAANVTVSFVTTITAITTLQVRYSINAYPNPFASSLIVENDRQLLRSLSIQNSLGKNIRSINNVGENRVHINTNSFGAGVYFITFYTKDGQTFTHKFVKQ